MKAVVLRGPGDVLVEERPRPDIEAPGDAIVRVTMTTICGTDIRLYRGSLRAEGGATVGHEFSGVIEEIGAGVSRLRRGQRVVSPFHVSCNGCFYCKKGLLSACERRLVFGFGLEGAQAEFVRVPSADAVLEPLPDEVTDTQAAFLSDVLPGTFAGLKLAGLQAGEAVAVLGCGPTGLCAQLLARAMGAATVLAIDHHPYRLAAAEALGSTPLNFETEDIVSSVRGLTAGRGADVVAEATGTADALVQAPALARPWGTVLNLGVGVGRTADAFPIGAYLGRHVRLVPAGIPAVKSHIASLVRMIARGIIDPTPIATHTLPLDAAPVGYRLMSERAEGALKVLLKP